MTQIEVGAILDGTVSSIAKFGAFVNLPERRSGLVHISEIASEYEKEFPEFRMRLKVKAGLTGYAQVYGKYNTTPYDKLQMDLMYMSKPSIVEDIKILFATFTILFKRESTEGVAPGHTNASEDDRKPAA